MSRIETRVTDSDADLYMIDRLELNRKIDRANSYVKKVHQRLRLLEQQRLRLLTPKDTQDVSQSFDKLLNKSSQIQKEL